MKRFASSPLTGSIRGIISCIILRYMEEQLQKQDNSQNKLGDYFDLVAGSSTGGLITSIMLYPDENRNARYSIQKVWNCIRKKEKISFRFLFKRRSTLSDFSMKDLAGSPEKSQRLLRKTGIKRTDKTLPDYKLRHRKQKG